MCTQVSSIFEILLYQNPQNLIVWPVNPTSYIHSLYKDCEIKNPTTTTYSCGPFKSSTTIQWTKILGGRLQSIFIYLKLTRKTPRTEDKRNNYQRKGVKLIKYTARWLIRESRHFPATSKSIFQLHLNINRIPESRADKPAEATLSVRSERIFIQYRKVRILHLFYIGV